MEETFLEGRATPPDLFGYAAVLSSAHSSSQHTSSKRQSGIAILPLYTVSYVHTPPYVQRHLCLITLCGGRPAAHLGVSLSMVSQQPTLSRKPLAPAYV